MPQSEWCRLEDSPEYLLHRAQVMRFMRAMDPRYRGFKDEQLRDWLDPNIEPYKNENVRAYAWYREYSQQSNPQLMRLVVICRYVGSSTTAELLMLGLDPGLAIVTIEELDSMVQRVLNLGKEWLTDLGLPTNIIHAHRPKQMGFSPAQQWHDRFYYRATQGTGTPVLTLLDSVDRGDGYDWTLRLTW